MIKCLQDIVQEVKELNTLTVCDRLFTIHFYLGGDWKFQAMVTGIDSSNQHFCVYMVQMSCFRAV